MKTINFAIVGCGRISSRHADSIVSLPSARLVAVCDIKKDRADKIAAKYKVRAYYKFSDLLKDKKIDVINLCTPSGFHPRMGIKAAEARKHIIVEKPIALNLKDARNLINKCKASRVKLSVMLQNRYNPAMQDLKKTVESGKLGKINLASICVRWYRPQSYYNDDWHGQWPMDGGAVINQSIHHLDALIWLLGMPDKVYAQTATLAHDIKVEDTAVAVFRYKTGALVSFEGSTITYPENLEASIAIFGINGSVKVGGKALNRKIFWKIRNQLNREEKILKNQPLSPPNIYGLSHREVIKDMIEAVVKNRQPSISGKDGYQCLKLALMICESAKKRKEISL